jgi:hypothetical protein
MPGIPVGPGTVFYLVAALAMPLVGVARRIAGRANPHPVRGTARQVAVATGMLLTGVMSLWLFDRVGRAVDDDRASGALLLSSPLLIALVVLVAMAALSRVVRRRRP